MQGPPLCVCVCVCVCARVHAFIYTHTRTHLFCCPSYDRPKATSKARSPPTAESYSSCLRLLPRLPVSFNPTSIFPSVTCLHTRVPSVSKLNAPIHFVQMKFCQNTTKEHVATHREHATTFNPSTQRLRYRLDNPGFWSHQDQNNFFPPNGPDGPWGSSSYRGSFPVYNCLGVTTTHIHLVSRLRMSGAIPPPPYTPSWRTQGHYLSSTRNGKRTDAYTQLHEIKDLANDISPFRNTLKRFLLENSFYNSNEYFNPSAWSDGHCPHAARSHSFVYISTS